MKAAIIDEVTDDRKAEQSISPEREMQRRFESAYDENGVDRSLIRFTLAQSVTDRVRAVEETLNALATVRRMDRDR